MQNRRGRGRPRSFDEDQVLDALLALFWTRGYAAASLDDLAEAAQVKRASLYLAFGDKETMYLKALERFAGRLEAAFAATLSGQPLAKGLNAFFQLSLDQYLCGDTPRGCLVLCTAPVEAPSTPAIKAMLADVLKKMDQAFAAAFARSDVPKGRENKLRAKLAAVVLHSLAVRARAGEEPQSLRSFAQEAARFLAVS